MTIDIELSDGSVLEVDDNTPPERMRVMAKEAEARLKSGRVTSAAPPAAETNPNSFGNVIGRAATSIAGVPDVIAGAWNHGATKYLYDKIAPVFGGGPAPELPEDTLQRARKAVGVAEMPKDAGALQQIGEGALAAIPYAAAGAVGAAARAPTIARAAWSGLSNLFSNTVVPSAGSYVGGQVGSTLGPGGAYWGGLAGGVAPTALQSAGTRAVESYYSRYAKPNAAQIADDARQAGFTPTAGMLGDEQLQGRERALNKPAFGSNPVQAARDEATTGLRNYGERIARDRGAITPRPTESSIGSAVIDAADNARTNLVERSSVAQQNLMDRIGADTLIDVTPVMAAGEAAARGLSTAEANLIRTHLRELYDPHMMRVDANGNPTGQTTYGQFQSWRSRLGRGTTTREGLTGAALDALYESGTGVMQRAAADANVPASVFNEAMNLTRQARGSGGPGQFFEHIAGTPGTSGFPTGGMDPGRAYGHVASPNAWQNPQRLEFFDRYASPQTPRIMGDTIRQQVQDTLRTEGSMPAAGPRNLADTINTIPERSMPIVGGAQAPDLQRLARLSDAYDYRPGGAGMTRALGGQTDQLGNRLVGAEALGTLGQTATNVTGIPGGRLAGYATAMMATPAVRAIQQRILTGEAARRGLSGGPRTPVATTSWQELMAAIAAASATAPPRMGP